MGLERRGNRLYWYDRKRVNGRVACEYVGPISPEDADLILRRAQLRRQREETHRAVAALSVERADGVLAAGAEFDRLAGQFFRAVMFLTGHAIHRRSEWWRTRGVPAMATIRETGAAPRALPNSPSEAEDAEVQALIEKAGRGAAPALLALRKILKRPEAVEALGYPAVTARATLIGMASHAQCAVAAELVAHCERQGNRLATEVPPGAESPPSTPFTPTLAEPCPHTAAKEGVEPESCVRHSPHGRTARQLFGR
jgi:hypothetical protein